MFANYLWGGAMNKKLKALLCTIVLSSSVNVSLATNDDVDAKIDIDTTIFYMPLNSDDNSMKYMIQNHSDKLNNLIGFSVAGTKIKGTGLRALADVIKGGKFPNLENLNVSGVQITWQDADYMAKALASGGVQNLTSLDFSKTNAGNEVAQDLSDGAKGGKLPNLKHILLSGTQIGVAGAKALADAVTSGKLLNLTTLDMSNTPIGQGVQTLAQAVAKALKDGKSLTNLKTILLFGTQIAANDAIAIANAVGDNGKLSNFQLPKSLSADTQKQLKGILGDKVTFS